MNLIKLTLEKYTLIDKLISILDMDARVNEMSEGEKEEISHKLWFLNNIDERGYYSIAEQKLLNDIRNEYITELRQRYDVDNVMTVIVNYEVIIYCRLISKAIGYFSQV